MLCRRLGDALRRSFLSVGADHWRPVKRPLQQRCDEARSALPRRKTWEEVAQQIEDPVTVAYIQKLDPSQTLWLDPVVQSKVMRFSFLQQVKHEHPERIVLVRSGEYYEAVGIDAVMLAYFASIPLMEFKGYPRVRCHWRKLRYCLHRIVQKCGFEVVIGEETGMGMKSGKKRVTHQHYVSAIIGGAGNAYYLSPIDAEEVVNMDLTENYPISAVYWSQTGYVLLQYFSSNHAVRVTSRMSEEALWAKLNSTGMMAPLYIHTSSLPGRQRDRLMQSWEYKAKEIAASVFGSVDLYQADDPMSGFLSLLRAKYSSIETENIAVLSEDVASRVLPPPLSTVSEIGICSREHSGVLPLMEYALPRSCQKLVIAWMRRCIMDPPSPEYAQRIQDICSELKTTSSSIPQLNARLPPNHIVEVLQNRKLTVEFLDALCQLLKGIAEFMSDTVTEKMTLSLLKLVEREMYVPFEKLTFLKNCQKCIDAITAVIRMDGIPRKDNVYDEMTNARRCSLRPSQYNGEESLTFFFEAVQHPLYSCINSFLLPEKHQAIIKCQSDIAAEIRSALETQLLGLVPISIDLNYDELSITFKTKNSADAGQTNIYAPDPTKPTRLCTRRLSELLSQYRCLWSEWEEAVSKEMDKLSAMLLRNVSCIVGASHASIILSALVNHVTEAQQRQWTLPDISQFTSKSRGIIEIHQFWPYWMDKDMSVTNSVSLTAMAILTGPNMAGKSTILRSIAAVCCLGVCGFFVPAESVKIPFIDSVNLKTLVTDSPMENLSAFGMEMTEMKHVLNDASDHSLVLIDELGKGTEVIGGTALSAAIFKNLYDRGANGVFATHLHRIATFKDDFPDAQFYRMEIQSDAAGNRKPSWKMVDGFCQESLGFEVALEQGVPRSIVERAQELIQDFETNET